jgi:amino acid transporter
MYLSIIGLNSPIALLVLVTAASAAMRLLPWERGRPWRLGFFLTAPLVAVVALAVALAGGVWVFHLLVFGLFEDKTAMPWLTVWPALLAAPVVSLGLGTLVVLIAGRILRYV